MSSVDRSGKSSARFCRSQGDNSTVSYRATYHLASMYKKRKIQETSRVAQRTISRSRSDGVELKNHLVSTAIDVGKCRSKYRDYSSFLSLPAPLLIQLINHVSSYFPLFLSSLGALLPTSRRSRIYRLSRPPPCWIGRTISRDKQRGKAFFNCPSRCRDERISN